MEKHHKNAKEKSNKIKLNPKKSISSKNTKLNIKQPNKTFSNNKKIIVNSSSINSKNIIFNNLKKYNATIRKYNIYITNAIIFDQRYHIVAVFKNYLLWDETSEFLKRYYRKKETYTRLPKISEYYERYTLFIPNYLANEGLIVIIMMKFVKRKKKYFKYLEDKEDEEENGNNTKKNNINKDFEPLIKNEILGKTKSKSLFISFLDMSKNTLELTNYENDFSYLNKIEKKEKSSNKIIKGNNLNKKNDLNERIINNSISFTEIFDDLSSHFSVLINNNNTQKAKKIPIKSLTNKPKTMKGEINNNNNFKKVITKHLKQKSLSRKDTHNKQQKDNKIENNNNFKSKDNHKTSKFKKKAPTKKITLSKENKIKENEKNIINNDNEKISNNHKEPKKIQLLEINSIKDKDNTSKIINSKNLKIINNNSNKTDKIKNNDNSNIMNTISNIKSHYYSFGKLIKNKKQRSAIKSINIKSLNLVNINQNDIPNLKKLDNKKRERRIIFPRNSNNIYNNNTNKLNSIKGENFEHTIKLLTDRDKENITLINENSKLNKINNGPFLNNLNKNQIISQKHKVDVFAQKVGKLIKKKKIYLIGDNLTAKDSSNKNSFLYKNENNENVISGNIGKLNNMHYKKNSVLRQFNSKKDFNFNNQNNIFYNYNNISNSNNSMNSSSSSSLNNLNKKRYKLSSNAISQNSSLNKIKKSLQKINLNLNLQINFNINIDKKNKKLILAKRLNNRIINEQINKKNQLQKDKINNNISNSNISVPHTQRYYYNINNKCHKFLGNYRSSSSSNSKKKKKGKIVI